MANVFAQFAQPSTEVNPFARFAQSSETPETAPPQENTRSVWEEALRQALLTGRAGLEGTGDTLDFMASPLRAVMGVKGRTGEAVADTLRLPKPESDTELLSNRIAGSMAGAMVPQAAAAKAVEKVGPMMSNAQRQFMELLASNPKAQALLAGLSGGAAEGTRQAGGDELTQMAAGMAAPVGVAATMPGVAAGMRMVKNVATAPFAGGAKQAAGRVAVDVAGDQAPAVIQAIRNGAPPETAAQAAMPAGRAEFAGLERTVGTRMPSAYGPGGTIEQGANTWQKGQLDALNSAEDVVRTQLLNQADTTGLDVANLSMKVAQLRGTPGYRDSTSSHLLDWLDKELVRRADKGTAGIAGVDLVDLRRDIGNKVKGMFATPEKGAQWNNAKAGKTLREIQKDIDMEIEAAVGNDRWTQELMGPSAQRRGELGTIRDRVDAASQMGAAGAAEARRISRMDESPVTLPTLLSRPMMLLNTVLRTVQGKGGERTAQALADLMQPHRKMGLAQLMEEEVARRQGRTRLAELLGRAGVAGAMQTAPITNE